MDEEGKLSIRRVAMYKPNEKGAVPKVSYSEGIDENTVAVVSAGNQIDIWFGNGIKRKQHKAIIEFISSSPISSPDMDIHISRQGFEGMVFRELFSGGTVFASSAAKRLSDLGTSTLAGRRNSTTAPRRIEEEVGLGSAR